MYAHAYIMLCDGFLGYLYGLVAVSVAHSCTIVASSA